MRKSSRLKGLFDSRLALLGVLVCVGGFFLFTRLPSRIAAMEKQKKYDGEFYEFAQLFSEIYADLQNRYVHEVDGKKMFEGAIRGMFTALDDPHSQWLSPDSLNQLEKETGGEFSGVGLHITLDQNVLTVIAPIPGSPAARAGVLPYDRVIEIDGASTEGITLLEAVKKLTGPTGSSVKVKLFREGAKDLLEFNLTRDTIKVQSVFKEYLGEKKDIGYMRLSRFSDNTADEVKDALEEFEKNHVSGLVVDLRFNSGGLLDKVIDICDYVFPKGQMIVSTKGRIEESIREFPAKHDPIYTKPMVVLVNSSSASASEIFAGAMQDTKRGVIIGPKGEKTFGKGSVQTITYLKHSLDRNDKGEMIPCGLRLTTALYYTPSGRTIHKIGITPDVEVDVSKDEQRNLLRHGLLGDPDMTGLKEPAKPEEGKEGEDKSADKGDKKPEAGKGASKPAEPAAAAPAKGDAKPSTDAAAPPAEFHDRQLEEGEKYLRTTLLGQPIAKSS